MMGDVYPVLYLFALWILRRQTKDHVPGTSTPPRAVEDPSTALTSSSTAFTSSSTALTSSSKPRARRSAEKDRISTCPFADAVAEAVIKAYHNHCPPELRGAYHQTVLSGFVLLNINTRELRVVGLGVGTKFVQTQGSDNVVRDMHAEPLARRAMQLWLLDEASAALNGEQSVLEQDELLRLRPGVELHLYSSSQPCGNATIRRWAKAIKPKPWKPPPDRDPLLSYPNPPHPKFYPTNKEEGQVAVLCKRERKFHTEPHDENTSKTILPPGTCTPSSGLGTIPTCSDKIAKWCALGVQGSGLAALTGPVYLSSVVVGRKFCEPHSRRAFCCRIQHFKHGIYSTHHPALLSTAVRFDTATLSTGVEGGTEGAIFNEQRCFYWSAARGVGSGVLDGNTGLQHSMNNELALEISPLSKARMQQSVATAIEMAGTSAFKADATYTSAKVKLLSKPSSLQDWPGRANKLSNQCQPCQP